jgi:tetratricopeptide (TPR) repeat protein
MRTRGGIPRPSIGRVPRAAFALVSIAAALLCAWAVWQPQRSAAESDRALSLIAQGKIDAAQRAAEHAAQIDPLASQALIVQAAVADARPNQPLAHELLEKAVRQHPGEPQVWIRLAEYELYTLNHPADAESTIAGALFLDPLSRAAQQIFLEAKQAQRPTPPVVVPLTPPAGQPAPAAPGRPAPTIPPASTTPAPATPQPPQNGAPGSGGAAPPSPGG